MGCVLCKGTKSRLLVDLNLFQWLHKILINDGASNIIKGHKELKFVYCLGCGLIYQQYPPSQETLSAYYKSWRQGMTQEDFNKYTAMKMLFNRERISWMDAATPLLKLKGKVLDIGTSDGSMCELFRQNGWDSFGIEQTREMCIFSKMAYKDINVINKPCAKGLFPEKSFDLVIFSNSLEHFSDPFYAMDVCSSYLKDNGYLYIEVPTFISGNFRELISAHFYIFTKNTLLRFLSDNGYSAEKTDVIFSKTVGQPYLSVLCRKAKVAALESGVNPKKEYLSYRRIVCYRYFQVFFLARLVGLLKSVARFILPGVLYKKIKAYRGDLLKRTLKNKSTLISNE